MLYIYGIVEDVAHVEDLRGVAGEPLRTIPVQGAVAVAGELDALPTIDAKTLKAQDAVVRALHERAAALLPMRFGTTAADDEGVVTAVSAIDHVRERLVAVRGCEQMIVRVIGAAARASVEVSAGSTGRAYLEARAKTYSTPPELTSIAAAAAGLQRELRIETALQPGFLGSIYHLIERGRTDEYHDAMYRAAAAYPYLHMIITGPFPAYAFV